MRRRSVEGKASGYCKIRKRVSSSSASSANRSSYRLKRAISVAKRANSSTPVPGWKMDLRSPSLARYGDKGKETQTSARKMAAALFNEDEEEEEKENFKGPHSLSPLCKKDGSKQSKHRRKSTEKLELVEYVHHGASAKVAETGTTVASRLKDVNNSLTTSKELVKVLFRLWSQENQNSSSLTLLSALKVELDRARHQVDHIMHEERYKQKEIDSLLKQFAYEKAECKRKEQERISNTVTSLSRELETEKRLRRQTERLNKTLGRELAYAKAELSKTVEELGCERKAREILAKTCDELAVGLGDGDRTELEELKRECDKVREETERERQMLQLADVLREERVQMKLADARYEYEEKNAALERMRHELESYLGEKARNSYGEDSAESELHSIELNMENLGKSYKWSYGNEESRRSSIDEVFKGRRSLGEKIQWENICLQRKTSDGLEWDFAKSNNNRKANGNTQDLRFEDEPRPPELGDSKTASADSGEQIGEDNHEGS